MAYYWCLVSLIICYHSAYWFQRPKTWKQSKFLFLLILVSFKVFNVVPFEFIHHRGLFCGDESIMYPLHASTVTPAALYSIGLIIPFVTIVTTEIIRKNHSLDDEKLWVKQLYKFYRNFLFGFLLTQATTDIGKYSIGRLRPHFLRACQPIIPPSNTTCSDPSNQKRYIEDFICANVEMTPKMNEIQLSFPSGHASFSMYAMVFIALYLHFRMNWRGSKLIKHILQFIFIMLAWYTSLSRISDYQSHCKLALIWILTVTQRKFIIKCTLLISRQGLTCLLVQRWEFSEAFSYFAACQLLILIKTAAIGECLIFFVQFDKFYTYLYSLNNFLVPMN